jgi:hypothetical protein
MLLRCENLEPPMSQLGQTLPSRDFCGTAAETGHRSARLARQKSAKTGREQMQQHAVRGSQGYLITSSARVSTALSHSASLIKNRLLLDLQDGAQITQPALRRATPKLYLWDKLVALASGADTDHVHLRPFAHGA